MTIPAKFSEDWLNTFRGEDFLNSSPVFFYFKPGGHFVWRSGLSDTILEKDYPRIIPAKFGEDWLITFREEDF